MGINTMGENNGEKGKHFPADIKWLIQKVWAAALLSLSLNTQAGLFSDDSHKLESHGFQKWDITLDIEEKENVSKDIQEWGYEDIKKYCSLVKVKDDDYMTAFWVHFSIRFGNFGRGEDYIDNYKIVVSNSNWKKIALNALDCFEYIEKNR